MWVEIRRAYWEPKNTIHDVPNKWWNKQRNKLAVDTVAKRDIWKPAAYTQISKRMRL